MNRETRNAHDDTQSEVESGEVDELAAGSGERVTPRGGSGFAGRARGAAASAAGVPSAAAGSACGLGGLRRCR